jgi:hypothetical protein
MKKVPCPKCFSSGYIYGDICSLCKGKTIVTNILAEVYLQLPLQLRIVRPTIPKRISANEKN